MSTFADIQALIIDPDGHSKALMRKLLAAFGLKRIMSTDATDEALVMLRRELFHIVFLDERAGPLKPLHFLKMLRRDMQTADVTIPVVLVAAGADAARITAARDAGMNDVIAKPVSVKSLERKLSALSAKTPFVSTKSFVGPDRRRSGRDRRQFGERPVESDRRGKKPGSALTPKPYD